MSDKKVQIIAYHTTEKSRADSIIRSNFFKGSTKSNEWLGAGIYFWDDIEDAEWWKSNIKNVTKENTKVIKVILNCKNSEYRDLTLKDNMNEYKRICKEVEKSKHVKVNTKSVSELRNLYCNYYKRLLKIRLISYEFVRNNNFGFQDRSIQHCLGEEFQKENLLIVGVV